MEVPEGATVTKAPEKCRGTTLAKGGVALIGGAALLALGLGAGVTVLLRRRARQTGGAIA
ncbi:hypothetical protein [Streptomyces sp. CB02400]|uniref:hypothetical protein n=1 Tax=Streptomyces sp. CB02400 TaxID=1703944 RepID=UPI00093AE18D|nr:hypothetical protein [Streptomyces sp. CB02400]OKK10897.1 hypothetical protein AMK33_12230 [Streptomyces sp. CB02400]